jgi:integrative and conjugative element protein (TIGR02256 family)
MQEIHLQKECVIVVAIEIANKCVKMRLPNGRTVDILETVFKQINKWIQIDEKDPESGGFILGYKHKETGNVSLEYVTVPQPLDIRDRINFKIRDPKHKILLLRGKICKSYYMGVWHTHPERTPIPSRIDWDDWNDTLLKDRTACEYVFFLIAGTEGIRIWVGDLETKKIEEIYECEKEGNIYK